MSNLREQMGCNSACSVVFLLSAAVPAATRPPAVWGPPVIWFVNHCLKHTCHPAQEAKDTTEHGHEPGPGVEQPPAGKGLCARHMYQSNRSPVIISMQTLGHCVAV